MVGAAVGFGDEILLDAGEMSHHHDAAAGSCEQFCLSAFGFHFNKLIP